MNTNGQTRPLAARTGFYSAQKQITWSGGMGNEIGGVTVNDTDIPSTPRAIATYTDYHTGETVVCGGTLLVIGTVLGCLSTDTADGSTGTYWTEFQGWFPVKTSDSVTNGAILYWDATNYEFTTTSSGNTAGAIAKNFERNGSQILTQTITTATLTSLPAGKWVHVMVQRV